MGDLIIAQVHVAAAPFAHRGSGGDGDFKFGPALETMNPFQLDGGFLQLRRGGLDFIEPEMSAAFFADGGVSA